MQHSHRPARYRSLLAIPFVLLAVIALVACGDDGSSSSSGTQKSTTTTGSANGAAGTATVALRKTDLGEVLVDAQGRTLYAFTPDSATSSACVDNCADLWPPTAAEGTPTAGDGVNAKLPVITRPDGSKQVAADGHPLYEYAGDSAAGDTTGQGSGGKWFVLSADGSLVKSDAGSTGSSTSTTAGSRYGY